jgi:hypothetical protein
MGSRLGAALALGACACAATGTEAPVATPPVVASPDGAFPVLPGHPAFGPVQSARQALTLALPDPDGWRVGRERSRFLVLEHPASGSALVVRAWRGPERGDRAGCERAARALKELPSGGREIERRRLDAPRGFDTEVVVSIAAREGAVRGHAVAFGGWARRCFAFAFSTSASGGEAERVVGERLAVITDRTLPAVELASDLAPALGPER